MMGRRVMTAQNWTAFRHLILWAKDDQPNGLQIMRGWSCWKAYSLSLNKGKAFMRIAHYFLLQQTYKTGPLRG